jgi:hypothetical protein
MVDFKKPLASLALLAAFLALTHHSEAQVRVRGAARNPLTGTTTAGRAGYNPMTGRAGAQRAAYNPYTGARAKSKTVTNPLTGRSATAKAAYNPMTGNYAYRYKVRR